MAARERRYGRRGRGGVRLLLIVAVLCVAALLIMSRVFTLKEIVVRGNEAYSDAEIAALSGLILGEDTLKIEKSRIKGNFSRNHYVELIEMDILYPDRVLLTVRERQPRAAVNCAGVILVIDAEGVILERMASMPAGDLITVSMNVSLSAQGRSIKSTKSGELEAMKLILAGLDAQGMTGLVSEINVRDRFNLYMVSNTGVQIILGEKDDLDDKLVLARLVLEKLTEEGVMSGVLDVSTGKNAVYADR